MSAHKEIDDLRCQATACLENDDDTKREWGFCIRVAKEGVQKNKQEGFSQHSVLGRFLGLGRTCVTCFPNTILFFQRCRSCTTYIYVPHMNGFSGTVSSESTGSLIKCFRGHCMLAPAIRELVVPPISRKARCPVEEWHVPSSLACERDQA